MEKPNARPEQERVSDLFGRLGGEPGIRRWAERFYDKIARHPRLSPLFPPDLTSSREKQAAFFMEMFGGPARYTERHGRPFLRFKHRHVRIGKPERDAWMTLVMEALREEVAEAAVIAEVERRLAPLADAMINHRPDGKDPYYFN